MVTLMKSFVEILSDLHWNVDKQKKEFLQEYLDGFTEVFNITDLHKDMDNFFEIKIFKKEDNTRVLIDNVYVPTRNLDMETIVVDYLTADYLNRNINVDLTLYSVTKLDSYFRLNLI